MRTAGSVVSTPRQFGPTIRIPNPRTVASSFACSAPPNLAGLAKARRDHDERLHALAPAVLRHALHEVARDDDHGEIHLVGDIFDARVGAHRLDGLRVRVHRVDGAGEGVREEVVEDLAADGAALSAGADHGDGAGGEERVQIQHGAGVSRTGTPRQPTATSLAFTPDPGAVAVSSSMRSSIYGGHYRAQTRHHRRGPLADRSRPGGRRRWQRITAQDTPEDVARLRKQSHTARALAEFLT
jgi:hypothetical protein